MKTLIPKLFFLPILIVAFSFIFTGETVAQTFANLHNFTNGSDGGNPYGGLILSGSTLYGAAAGGGTGSGTLFAVNINGTGFSTLYSFTAASNSINIDGASPQAGLILSGSILYGTAASGGDAGKGTVFCVNTNGTAFTVLHSFTATSGALAINSDGASPQAGLILSGNTLYGTTRLSGAGYGTVFRVNTDGSGFTNLHSFVFSSEGANPQARLVLSGNTLYGTVRNGGSGDGSVFAVNTDGTGFRSVYNFINSNGGNKPTAGLLLSGDTLYGTAQFGGSANNGAVYAVNTDGSGFRTLHSFTGSSSLFSIINNDGARPISELVLSGNTLYGTANRGGVSDGGTMFAVNTDGTGFKTLRSLTSGSDGANPPAGLVLSAGILYGTATSGGGAGAGTLFSLSLPMPPQLSISRSLTNVILTWPTNVSGFALQSTTNLITTNIWSTVSPAPVVVNGQNTVTNSISGTSKFYRLAQ